MAKGFSDREREAIRQKLMDSAETCWGKFGLKKTTVDQLVGMASISKGAFYIFYTSKEHLFMDAFERIEARIKNEIMDTFKSSLHTNNRENFVSVILHVYKEMEKNPWILNIQSGDLELLLRKLPPERIKRHIKSDNDVSAQLFALLGIEAGEYADIISGVLRTLFLMLLHKKEIGEEHFDKVVSYMVEAVAMKLFDGGEVK